MSLREFTRHLIQLRATQPLLLPGGWRDGLEIAGLAPAEGAAIEQWDEGSTIGVCVLVDPRLQPSGDLA